MMNKLDDTLKQKAVCKMSCKQIKIYESFFPFIVISLVSIVVRCAVMYLFEHNIYV